MKILSVIPLKKAILKGDLTYFTGLNVSPGDIVSVPIRSKKILALVTSSEDLKEAKTGIKEMNFNLKKVTGAKGPSIFSKEFIDAAFATSKYFTLNQNNTLASLIPNILLEGYDKLEKIKLVRKNTEIYDKNIKSEKLLLQYPFDDRISVYKTLIRESFARGKSIIVVLPTEYDIEIFSSILSKGIEQFTLSMYSGITAKKGLILCEKMITTSHPVLVLCTAPFLAIPRNDVGTIILEHENSSAYKTIAKPHLDLRIFVEIFASKINARYIMADEMLRFETIERKDMDNINPLHPLSFRIDFNGEIFIQGKKENVEKKFQIFENITTDEIRSALKNKQNIFIFSLRKGLATMTVCRDCGEAVGCDICGAPLVLYSSHQGKNRMFVCNRCEREIDGDVACISCGSWNLMPLGIGTDTVCEEIEKKFPKVKIFKLDKESAKTSAGAKRIIKDFENSQGAILIGTEMVFYYLKEKVPLSIVAAFDSLWSIPNFRMSEKILQIILSLIRNTIMRLIIQTKNYKDEAILAIESRNLLSFVRKELESRQELNYPPFRRFIKITHTGDRAETTKARRVLAEVFKEYTPEIFSGFVSRLGNKYVTNALIKLNPQKWSLPELKMNSSIDENLFNKLNSLPPTFEVLVDPEDLL